MRGKHNDKTYKYTNMYNDECTTIDTIEIKHIQMYLHMINQRKYEKT